MTINCSPLYNDGPKNAPEKLPSLNGHCKYPKVTDRLGQRHRPTTSWDKKLNLATEAVFLASVLSPCFVSHLVFSCTCTQVF